MSVSSSSSSTDSSGYSLTSLTGSTTLQVTGLSSGLNTNSIVEELMQAKDEPMNALKTQSSLLTARDTELTSLQTELQTVQNDAQALLDPSLFSTSQTVSSSDPSMITATAASASGAVEGGYEVSVTALAQSAQRTYTYTPPSSADTITIDGQAVTVAAGESASNLANSINGNSNLDVYATATQSGNLVLSNRATGLQTGSYIQVSDPGGALTEVAGDANAGQDAAWTIGSTSGTSASNTVTDAIPGVSLTLNGLTGSTPVTVDVDPPAVNTTAVQTALQQFVTDYNTAVTSIQTQLQTTPADTNSTETGTLYDDQDLQNLLSQMRSMMVQTVSGVTGSTNNMLDVGVSTGATTGSGSLSASAISGDLTLNTATLASAVASDPDGVQNMLAGWASSFSTLVGTEADPGGTMDQRVAGNTTEINDLTQQISTMQSSLNDQQQQLVNQFAAMESSLSTTQSESSWLTQQISALG